MLDVRRSTLAWPPVELGHRLINKREAQRSFHMVARRHQAGPFVLSTKLRLEETADHPYGNGTVARALFDPLMNHVRRP